MPRILFAAAAVAVALLVVGSTAAAPPEGSLRFILVPTGDGSFGAHSFVQTETVYQRGRAVGTGHTACRWRGDFENPRCTIRLVLPAGALRMFLRIEPDPRGSVTVRGLTGAYRGRAGVGIFRAGGPSARYTLWLTSQRSPAR